MKRGTRESYAGQSPLTSPKARFSHRLVPRLLGSPPEPTLEDANPALENMQEGKNPIINL
jgi:hypothetical protein